MMKMIDEPFTKTDVEHQREDANAIAIFRGRHGPKCADSRHLHSTRVTDPGPEAGQVVERK